jgi:hypothetical protein
VPRGARDRGVIPIRHSGVGRRRFRHSRMALA